MGTPPQGHPSLLHTWGRRRVSATLRVHSLPSRLRGALKVCDVRMSRAALARQAYRFVFPPGRAGGKSLKQKKQQKKKRVVCLAIFSFFKKTKQQKKKNVQIHNPFFFFVFPGIYPGPARGEQKTVGLSGQCSPVRQPPQGSFLKEALRRLL